MTSSPSGIHRRWPDTVICAAAGAALLAWSASLFHSTFLGGAAAGTFGAALLFLAVLGPASGPCPMCGETLHGLFALTIGEYERCPHCRRYWVVATGAEVGDSLVAPQPAFSVPVGRGERMPQLCCVCGAAAERTTSLVHRTEGRVSHVSPVVMSTTIDVDVPYCGRHEGGVMILNEDLAPSRPLTQGGQQETDNRWVLRVRSYAFYRAAVT